MRLDPDTRRRSIVPILAGLLAVCYLLVFMPIERKASGLADSLTKSWNELAETLGKTNEVDLDFVSLTNQFQTTQISSDSFERALHQARERVKLDVDLRVLLDEPFLLVHYQYEAGLRMDALTRLAKKEGVALDPAVLMGFPEQSADMPDPALLWAQLSFLDSLVTAAINAKVQVVHKIGGEMPTTGPLLSELPVNIELSGSAANVAKFLQTIPLRTAEIEAQNLPAVPANKPALFIDQMVLLKQSPEKLDEVRLTVRVVGYVFRR
jgi:hypothetical protein